MLSDAIRAHHDLLTDDSATASQERLDEQQERRGLSFGNRARCTVLRARFLSVDEYRFLRSRTNVLLQAFDAVYATRGALRVASWLYLAVRNETKAEGAAHEVRSLLS